MPNPITASASGNDYAGKGLELSKQPDKVKVIAVSGEGRDAPHFAFLVRRKADPSSINK